MQALTEMESACQWSFCPKPFLTPKGVPIRPGSHPVVPNVATFLVLITVGDRHFLRENLPHLFGSGRLEIGLVYRLGISKSLPCR